MHMGKDIKVLLNGKELLVQSVEVSYSVEDLPSVSIEGLLPRDFEATVEVKYDEGAEKIIRDMLSKNKEARTYMGIDMAEEGSDRTDAMIYAMKAHEIEMNTAKEWSDKEINTMRGYDGDCEAKACDDGSYGAHGIAKKFVNLSLDDDQKLIARHELKQEDGTLTAKGKELLLTILFDEYEEEVVEALKAIEEAAKEAREARG